MKIGLIGYGKMGKTIETLALKMGHEVTVGLDPIVDVAIDFTEPQAVKQTAEALCLSKIPWVIGTTGWEKEEVLNLAEEGEIPVLYSPNFSIGIAVFSRLAKLGATLIDSSYAKTGIEIHHDQKKDAPSGTAIKLMGEVPGLSFESIRSGHHIGVHQVIFDSLEDTIELTHRAKNREGYAKGAILAAEWLLGRKGIYTFDDFIKERFFCHFQEQSQL